MPHLQLGIQKYSSLILVTTAYTQVLKQDSLLGKIGRGLNNSIVTVCQSKKCFCTMDSKGFGNEYLVFATMTINDLLNFGVSDDGGAPYSITIRKFGPGLRHPRLD